MSYTINHFIQDYAEVITKIMQAEVDTNSSQDGVQKPGEDVAFDILRSIINGKESFEKYNLREEELTEKLQKDFKRVLAG